jgi:hypothetical protein
LLRSWPGSLVPRRCWEVLGCEQAANGFSIWI